MSGSFVGLGRVKGSTSCLNIVCSVGSGAPLLTVLWQVVRIEISECLFACLMTSDMNIHRCFVAVLFKPTNNGK